MATLPMVLRYAVELRGYGLLLLATAVAFAAGRRIAQHPRCVLEWWVLTTALVCGVSTHLVGVLLVLPVMVFILMHSGTHESIPRGRLALVGIAAVGLDLVLRFGFLTAVPANDWWMPRPSLDLLFSTTQHVMGFTASLWEAPGLLPTLPQPTFDLVLRRFSELLWLAVIPPVVVMGRWREGRPFLAAGLLFLGELLAVSVLVVPVLWYRTVLPAIVPLFGFVAVMIATARGRVTRIVGGIAVASLAVTQATGWFVNRAEVAYEPWSQASEVLDFSWRPGMAIYVYPAETVPALQLTSAAARYSEVQGIDVGAEPDTFSVESGRTGAVLVSRWDMRTRRDPTRNSLPEHLSTVFGPPGVDLKLGVLRVRAYSQRARTVGPAARDGGDHGPLLPASADSGAGFGLP